MAENNLKNNDQADDLLNQLDSSPEGNQEEIESLLNTYKSNNSFSLGNINDLEILASTNDQDGFQKRVLSLFGTSVNVSVVLGESIKPLGDIMRLGKYSVLELDRNYDAPVDIYVNNYKFAQGKLVAISDEYGVEVTELLYSTKEEFKKHMLDSDEPVLDDKRNY